MKITAIYDNLLKIKLFGMVKEIMKNFNNKFLGSIFAAILFLCGFISIGECREVVFVINSGNSMNRYDPFHTAAESVIWGGQNLSNDDEVGIILFNDNVNIIRPLSKISEKPVGNFFVDYQGNSDAGAGLLAAIDMLTPKFNTRREIIFITNGEIQKSQSVTNFQAGLKQANWLGITVYHIDLRYNVDPKEYRLYKDQTKDLPINYRELMTTIRTILQGDWHTPHIELPTNNLTKGNLNFTVPINSAEKFKIALLSSSAGKAVFQNIKPASTIQGNFINIFEINSPSTNNFEIAVDYPQGTGLTLDVIPTVSGQLAIDYQRLPLQTILKITPVYANNPESKILDDEFFDDKPINLLINNKKVSGEIQDGVIKVPIDDFDENISLQKIHFEDVGIIFNGNDTAEVFVRKIPYGALLITLAGLLIIGGLSWRIHRKNSQVEQIEETTRAMLEVHEKRALPIIGNKISKGNDNQNFSYGGKLLIYVIKTPDEDNVAPREFNLFRMNSAQISLAYILEQCGIEKFAESVRNIFISPAQNGINLENKSACTITKRDVLIERDKQAELYYNDSANIFSEDDLYEMILQYKSLKPN